MTPSPEEVFATVADRPGAAWLDSGDGSDGWSILTWDPVEVLTDGERWPEAGRARTRPRCPSPGVPFAGGVLGYVGFGAGHRVEPVPAEAPSPEPELWLGRYEGGLCFRHADRSWHPAGSVGFQRQARDRLDAARPLPPPPPPPAAASRSTVARDHHEAGVRRILEWIRAGDCYQVNLTRAVRVTGAGPPFPAYRRLRRSQARHGGFLNLGGEKALLSNSPEELLTVRGRQVSSTPIKGTRPRGETPEQDRALLDELEHSDKERAELTMIVDLVRNDLSRVCRPGSVVAGRRTLTTHPTLHHAGWTVRGELDADADAWSALAAAFPPGSVTGAPKIRACQRIAELEAGPRGAYCGAFGYAADGGDAAFAVAIRIAVFDGPDARYHVGGGIVIDSDPAAEWDETLVKETALRRALLPR